MVNIEDYIQLSKSVASKCLKKFGEYYTFDELLSFAQIGLVKAAKKFDESKGFKFSTYSSEVMYHTILMGIRDDRWFTGTREATTWLKPVLYESTANEEGNTFLELMSLEFYEFENIELKNLLSEVLDETEFEIIMLAFFEERTQKEIGSLLGCTQSSVSKIKKQALEKLREAVAI